MTDKEVESLMIDLICNIARQEIVGAIKEDALPDKFLKDESFFKGVTWGMALAMKRLGETRESFESIENIIQKALKTQAEKN